MINICRRFFSSFLAKSIAFIFLGHFFPSGAKAADGRSFFEDFSDGKADGWTFSSDRWKVENGKLRVHGPGKKSGANGIYLDIATYGAAKYDDFRMDVKVNREAGKNTSAAIVVGLSDHTLYFTLSNYGGYVVFMSGSSNPNIVTVTTPGRSQCINAAENKENDLSLARVDADFSFSINGCLLATYHDESMGEATLGLMTMLWDTPSSATFDNIRVTAPALKQRYGLTVKSNSPDMGKIDVSGVDCTDGCPTDFIAGTEVLVSATAGDNWKVETISDDNKCYPGPSASILMNKNKTVIVKFAPKSAVYSLMQTDTTVLGSRIPLILIHGNSGEEGDSSYGWSKYVKAINSNKTLKKKFKIYLFRWDSNLDSKTGGLALGYFLDKYPETRDKKITILAHSRGGLIARYFMNYYGMTEGSYVDLLAGEKVYWLITLATPHHGTPGADPMWMDFSINYRFKSPLALLLSYAYFQNIKPVWVNSDMFLQWDDMDNVLTDDTVCWDSALNGKGFCSNFMSNASDLRELNNGEQYFDKIIVYGGNRFDPKANIQKVLNNLNSSLENSELYLASLLMATVPVVPNGYPSVPINNSLEPFQANDGLVPLVSALCLQPGSGSIFSFNKQGKLAYNSQALGAKLMVNKAFIVEGLKNHQDFLTDTAIINSVLKQLK